MNEKKITIRDLCPDEKAKIGELIKKLSRENEEKEKLQKQIEEEKKIHESQIEQIEKEK